MRIGVVGAGMQGSTAALDLAAQANGMARKLAEHLRRRFPQVKVRLIHRELQPDPGKPPLRPGGRRARMPCIELSAILEPGVRAR